MTGCEPSPDRAALGRQWRRWTEVVGWFALKRPARRWVRAAEYEALHRELVANCRRLAEAGPDGADFDRLATLAGPWLSTGELERTDRALLLDLMARCRAVD